MAMTINAAGFYTGTENAAVGEKVQAEGRKSIYAGNAAFADPIAQRREEARRQAWNVVKNAWDSDRYVDDSIQSKRDHYAELAKLREELRAGLSDADSQKESARELFAVSKDSKEQQDLELLEKEQDIKNGVLHEGLTEEELARLEEIHKTPLTEYQSYVLEVNDRAGELKKQLEDAEKQMRDDTANINRMKVARLEEHAMVDAQKAADEIMDAANKEIIGMLVEDAKDHVDEQTEETKEKAEDAMQEKEKREEELEEIKLERAIQRAMVEGTDEAVEKAERIKRQKDAEEIQLDDMVDIASAAATQKDVNQSLSDIKSSMKVLEADLKGLQVDEQT